MSEGDEELAKDLGLLSALTIGIGTMIGAGIFVLPGVAAQEAGPIVVASFLVGGVVAMVNAFTVSELGTAMPKAGGGYYYINRSLGPLFGSVAGMGDWMGLAFASAFYCIGFGQYLATLAPVPGLLFLTEIQVGAVVAGVIFVGVNYIGAKETGGIQTVIVLVLLSILSVFAVFGWLSFDWATLVGEGGLAPMGYGAILPGTAVVFVSFLGYAKIATIGEELKNPGRNLPLAIIGSVAIVTVVYAILVTIMLGVVPWPELSPDAPVAQVTEAAFPGGLTGVAVTVVTLAALLATASSANASILASARINFAMGRDGIVTDWLNDIHPSFATPYRSILVTGGLIVVFIAVLGRDLSVLAKAASGLHLVVYTLTNVALIVFRETDAAEYDPDFEVPLYPITPVVGALCSVGLIAFLDPIEIALTAAFVVAAVVWFFLYARRRATFEGELADFVTSRADEMPDSAVSAAGAVAPNGVAAPDGGQYRVMVPLANPEHERALITLASAVAKARGGSVVATHVVTVPDQTSLEAARDRAVDIDATSQGLLDRAREDTETFGVDVETHTVFSHQGFAEVFDAADAFEADLVVMGWGPSAHWSPGRVEGALDDIAGELPCDVLALRDRDFDASRILLPTAGGPDSDLGAEVTRLLAKEFDSEVTLLYVADESEEAQGAEFLAEWADEHDLADAQRRVETGDVERAIESAAADSTLVVLGASEQGLLQRLLGRSVVGDVVEDVDSSVLLAQKRHERSLRERLFG